MPKTKKKNSIQISLSKYNLVLMAVLVLVFVQAFQLYSMKRTLASEGLGALSQTGATETSSQSSAIPDQVGGCFR